ncbi:protein FAM185A isoform X2 [Dermacentor albipictus]|uniref:protein FAM185A isoform X2 n=1 Tax=Dermacentor albipictus TaxID=60249 RepID=UPI0031FDFA6D
MFSLVQMTVAKFLRIRAYRSCCLWATSSRMCADDTSFRNMSVVLDDQRAGPLRQSAVLRVQLPCSLAISAIGDDSAAVTARLLGARPQLFLGGESPIALSIDGTGAGHLSVTGVDGGGGAQAARPDLLCRLRVPFMTSIDVDLSRCAQAVLENLVLDQCRVMTHGSGDITLSNVKANSVTLNVEDGSIKATGTLQGNLEAVAQGSGGFEAKRFLANCLKVKTLVGQQRISAVYADKACLDSTEGAIDIGTLHSQDAVLASQSGAITLGGLDGERCTVTTDSGDVSVVVAQSQHLSIVTESDVHSHLEPQITTRSRSGSVIIKKQDWITSLNLGGGGGRGNR